MIRSRKVTAGGYEVVFEGVVSSQEMFEIGEDFKNQPDFEKFTYILMHFTAIENMLIDTAELMDLAHLDRQASQRNPNLQFAVAAESPLVFGLARMWEAFYGEGPWQPRVFSTLAEARQWVAA